MPGHPRPQPAADCELCPRLVDYRHANQAAHPDWHNAPVASFGDPAARLLIVGLAPGVTGANRTGRPFTGDYAGDLLYPTLIKFDFATGSYGRDPGDGLELVDCRITNAVRCVPPQNKPTGAEIRTCRQFLVPELTGSDGPAAVLALGRIAHDSILASLGHKLNGFKFAHAACHQVGDGAKLRLYDSYHCSRYNTNTGRLTPEMFEAVFELIRADLG
jgi:uracil-DNA glycosylase family 4